jgi:cytochrome c biogenesis protein CcmG, thiol:disulfide interchange protein DsbE
MTRLPLVLFVACSLTTVPVLVACDPAAPAAPPDPTEILKQANAAAAKLTGISYQARFYGDGVLAAQVPPMEGKVIARRDPVGKQHSFRIEGTAINPSSPEKAVFAIAFDGKNVYSADHTRRTFASGPVEEGSGVSNPLFQTNYLHEAPFDEQLKNGTLEYRGIQDVDGVACDAIAVHGKGAKPSLMTIFLGKQDRLLRRFESTVQSQAPSPAGPVPAIGRIIFTVSSLVPNPDTKDETFRLECPDGFQKQPLQTNRAARTPDQLPGALANGSPAPDWELKAADGKTVSLKSLRGKVVVIDFWATWCGPCKMAMPGLQKLHERFKDKPVVVFGVNCRERPGADPMAYVKEKGYTYPQLLNGESAAEAYKVNGIPSLFVIDPDGKLMYSAAGFSPAMEDMLTDIIQKAIKK